MIKTNYMKKIILLAAVLSLMTVSCKKDRTCTCVVTYVSSTVDGVPQPLIFTTATYSKKLTKVTKKGAHCVGGQETNTQIIGLTTTVDVYKTDCKLD